MRNAFSNPFTLASLAVVLTLGAASQALAIIIIGGKGTGLVGITPDQRVSINVVLTPEGVAPPEPDAPPLDVEMTLYGADGGVLAQGRGTLGGPDTALHLEKRATELFPRLRAGERGYLRAEVKAYRDGDDTSNPDSGDTQGFIIDWAVTVEVIDNATGRTALLISPGAIKGFNPQPDPPGHQ